jgi:hypothetical protein
LRRKISSNQLNEGKNKMAKKDTEGTRILYAISEEHHKVVAYIPNGYEELLREVKRKLEKINRRMAWGFEWNPRVEALTHGKNLCGEANCHPNDVWNEERGRAIARARLLRHKSRMKMRLYSIAMDMAEGWINRIGDLWEAEMYRVEDMEGELEIHLEDIQED